MKDNGVYDINLFVQIIDFIVKHGDEPELYMDLKDGTRIEFICYSDFIDAYVGERCYKFSSIADFTDNMIINGKSLRDCWNDVIYIDDDCTIDYSQKPTEQFDLSADGRICYKVIR